MATTCRRAKAPKKKTPRAPANPASLKNRRAKGIAWAPLSKPIRTDQIVEEREKRKTLDKLTDHTWLEPGALAFSSEPLGLGNPISNSLTRKNLEANPDIPTLAKTYKGDPTAIPAGTAFVYIGKTRMEVKTPRGNARIVKHLWANGTGKFIVPFDVLIKGSPDDSSE
jgi:hypothetical protein